MALLALIGLVSVEFSHPADLRKRVCYRVAENIGHVKWVGQMTGVDTDPLTGRALAADGVATVLAGMGGGSATTTYAENIGVMAATRVYSTAAYWVAGIVAMAFCVVPEGGSSRQSPRECWAVRRSCCTASSACSVCGSG